MPMFSKRPASLSHLSDEQAARALSRRFGDVVKAAKDLGVDRRDLRRLIWSNPAILDAAHERMELFVLVRRDEVMSGLLSNVASVRRRAIDKMFANPVLFDPSLHPALSLFAPAPRVRKARDAARASEDPAGAEKARVAGEVLAREAAPEQTLERDREAAAERVLEQERSEVMVERGPPVSPVAPAMSLWPSGIRRPSRGRRR
jgi:hypothetical protein